MEFVYVVPRPALFPDCTPHGLQAFGEALSEEELMQKVTQAGYFVERDWAERHPSVKQIIPYTILWRSGEVFLLRRTKRGGESRLHDKLSIGVGGHVNPEDASSAEPAASRQNPIPRATEREIREELCLEGPIEVAPVGILNDDTNPVGAVHLGLVQVLATQGDCEVRETEQLEGRWVSLAALKELWAAKANFETWSSLLIPRLETLVSHTETARAS